MTVIIPSHNEKYVNSLAWAIEKLYGFKVIISHDPDGKGKGWAIREGIKKSGDDEFIFIDGDWDINPRQIREILYYPEQAVIGRKSIKNLPFKRKIITLISRLLIKIFFRLPCWDTQTGLKLWRNPPEFKTDGFLFDVEMLSKAESIQEVPIEVNVRDGVRKGELWKSLKDLLTLSYRITTGT
jgi:glycosyltransferase involved in cell wall biosynthesis